MLSYTSKDGQLVFTKLPVLEITWWIIYNFNISSYVLKSSNSLVSRNFGICMTGAYSVCYVRLLSFRLVSIRPSVLFTSVAALANYEFFPSSVSSSFSQNLLNNFFIQSSDTIIRKLGIIFWVFWGDISSFGRGMIISNEARLLYMYILYVIFSNSTIKY